MLITIFIGTISYIQVGRALGAEVSPVCERRCAVAAAACCLHQPPHARTTRGQACCSSRSTPLFAESQRRVRQTTNRGRGTSHEEEDKAFGAVAAGNIGRHVRGTVTGELREEFSDGGGGGDGGGDDDLQANIFIHLPAPRVVAGYNEQVS